MAPIPSCSLVDAGNPTLWAGWATLLRDNEWTSDDNTLIELLPVLPSTRVVFAKDDRDGSFLGCVVWNETDEIAYLGYYLVHPSMVGKGVGSTMWKRAMERIPRHLNLGLRAVPEMTAKYAARDTPHFVSHLYNYELTIAEARKMCAKVGKAKGAVVSVAAITDDQWSQLLAYDSDVTSRDRSLLLEEFFECDLTEGVCLLDENDAVIGYAAVTSTCYVEDNMFKLGPVFASTYAEAFTLIRPLIDYVESIHPSARIFVKTLSGTVGETAFGALIEQPPELEGTTLFQRPFKQTIDSRRCFVAHNHGGHFDA